MENIAIFVEHDKAHLMHNNLAISFQKPVFLDHDGSIDDYIALITLLTIDKYRLTGISVCKSSETDSSALDITIGILHSFCRYDVEVVSNYHESMHDLLEQRGDKSTYLKSIDGLTTHNGDKFKISNEDAVDFMARKILEQEEKTIVILTCSALNFSQVLKKYPAVIAKIEKILWVAGAFLADGNVVAPDHDGSAEWNIFVDPAAASDILNSGIQIMLFPLDAISLLPVDNYFMYNLGENKHRQLSNLVYQIIENDYIHKTHLYLNSLLPIVYLAKPEIFELESKSIKIEQRGTSKGNIYRTSLGQRIKHVTRIEEEEYSEFLIQQFQLF